MAGDVLLGTVVVIGAQVFGPVLRVPGDEPVFDPSLPGLDAVEMYLQAASCADPSARRRWLRRVTRIAARRGRRLEMMGSTIRVPSG